MRSQAYKNVKVIVGYDHASGLTYIPDAIDKVVVFADQSVPYFYDLYCNDLKRLVANGWFFFLDDDDVLASPTVLEELADQLKQPGAIICQVLRNGLAKPRDNYIKHRIIEEGKIGLPCLVLHSKYKAIGALDGEKGGDYRYIKYVTCLVPTKYICLPLVDAGSRGHGRMETKAPNSNISE